MTFHWSNGTYYISHSPALTATLPAYFLECGYWSQLDTSTIVSGCVGIAPHGYRTVYPLYTRVLYGGENLSGNGPMCSSTVKRARVDTKIVCGHCRLCPIQPNSHSAVNLTPWALT